MADYLQHLEQAEHNESLCKLLATQHESYRDWLITISFYAAIHYVEAGFAQDRSIGHSEKHKREQESEHTCRQRLVRQKYDKACWLKYKLLREASHNVRYLGKAKTNPLGTAVTYYTRQQALDFYRVHLDFIKKCVLEAE